MNAQPMSLSRPTAPASQECGAARPVHAEPLLSSEDLLNGRREILISHGDRVYRLRHTAMTS